MLFEKEILIVIKGKGMRCNNKFCKYLFVLGYCWFLLIFVFNCYILFLFILGVDVVLNFFFEEKL